MSASFSPETMQHMAEIEEVDIETQQDGAATRTTIWIVTVNDEAYVRSVKGERGQWYQAARANPQVAFFLGSERIPARVDHVTDAQIISRVSEAYLSKYHDSLWAPPMAEPETLPTTLHLVPR